MFTTSFVWYRLHFHFRTFQGIPMTSKGFPNNATRDRFMWSSVIHSIQIGHMALIVPPRSTLDPMDTVKTYRSVVVVVFRSKLHIAKNKNQRLLWSTCGCRGYNALFWSLHLDVTCLFWTYFLFIFLLLFKINGSIWVTWQLIAECTRAV